MNCIRGFFTSVMNLVRRGEHVIEEEELMANLITYKIVNDVNGRLKAAARIACNFWNRFIEPASSIVIRLGTFTAFGNTIARAYTPYKMGRVLYGRIEFNTNFMSKFSDSDIAGVIIHEIGHTIGYGWEKWESLFNATTGRFTAEAIAKLPSLADMYVETDYGPGTTLSHWDEDKHGAELMTGIRDKVMHVLPVTIDVTSLLGNKVIEHLKKRTPLSTFLADAMKVEFTLQKQAKELDLDYFVPTPIWEETYDFGRRKRPQI
jgi:hypothetical protein